MPSAPASAMGPSTQKTTASPVPMTTSFTTPPPWRSSGRCPALRCPCTTSRARSRLLHGDRLRRRGGVRRPDVVVLLVVPEPHGVRRGPPSPQLRGPQLDRESGVLGKRGDLGGGRGIKKKNRINRIIN